MIAPAVLQTLKYSNHFDHPLTLEEIHSRLCSSDPCSLERVIGTLRSMLDQHQIQKTGDYYHLPGHKSLVARRLKRAKLSTPQLTRARVLANQLGKVPGVLAIYLTGSLAMKNSDANSDIDFMIITQSGRLWTTRLFLTLYTSLLGLRRTPGSTHNSGKVCLNLYLTQRSYLIPTEKQSLYTAYELIQAVPLYDPHNTQSDLLFANSWIQDFLPNVPIPERTLLPMGRLFDRRRGRMPSRDTEGGRSLPVGSIESLSYHLQLWYMRSKLTREYVTPDSAFFHPHNPAPKV